MRVQTLRAACAAAFVIAGACAASAHAQAWPAKPITVVVAFSAGGNNDLRARQLAEPVGAALGQPVVIENKPGASGNIGHDIVARAKADGYTLGIGAMGPLAVNAALFPKLTFDPAKDFVPVVLIEKAPLVLVTHVDKPYRSVKDVIDQAKARPGHLTIGNAGTGGAHHLSGELFQDAAGLDMIAVPYKGGGPAATALLGGEIDMMFEQTYAAIPSIQAGRVRALAVTSDKRLPGLPDVPTMSELGFPQVTVSNWLGLIAPAGTPAEVVKKLNAAYNQALATPEMQQRIAGPGNTVGGGTPEAFGSFIESESKRWSALIKAKNIRLE